GGQRSADHRHERHRPGPDGRSKRNMDEQEPPRKVRAVLELAQAHLREDEPDEAEPEPEEPRGPLPFGSQVAEPEDEAEPEDGHRSRVDDEHHVEPAETDDAVSPG